jgi:hypothetical protein
MASRIQARPPEPSAIVRVADGVYARRIERRSPLPAHLDSTAHEGHIAPCACRPLLSAMTVLRRFPLHVQGTRALCEDEHAFTPWLWGVFSSFELRLARCRFCGTVEVRDVSFDLMPGIKPGRSGPRRRSDVLGWYSGKRPNSRTYT